MPPAALAAPTVVDASAAPAPIIPAPIAAPVAAAPPAVSVGLPASIEAAIAGICIAMKASNTEPPITVRIALNFSPLAAPRALVSMGAQVTAAVFPMLMIR